MFEREIRLDTSDLVVRIDQQETGDVGCVVWDACLVLAKYLDKRKGEEEDFLTNQTVLELGAGTGALGIIASLLGAKSLLTDQPEFISLINHNLELNSLEKFNKNSPGSALAATLSWGNTSEIASVNESGPFDYILVADCVYYEESVEDFVSTLEQCSSLQTTILLSYEDRYSEAKLKVKANFFRLMEDKFYHTEVPTSEHHQDFATEDIHIIKFLRRT